MARSRSQIIESTKKGNCSDSDSKNCEVISTLLLPELLMFDILRLVPLNCLINSARYVCKAWAATIASSLFVEMCESCARSKPGLYVENHTTQSSSYFLEFIDDMNGQFERTDLGTPPRMRDLIATCDGILLLSNDSRETFVVNPILKCWLRIPPFPSSVKCIKVNHQCTTARVPRTRKFKLFLVDVLKVSGAFWYVFYVLRIGIDNSWKEIARKESHRIDDRCCFFLTLAPHYSGGIDLYWMSIKEVIVLDVDKEIILRDYPVFHLPHGPYRKYLWMGNSLSCIVATLTTYEIYILDYDSGKWSLYHEMEPFVYRGACGPDIDVMSVVFRFWINDQIIFRFSLHQDRIGNILSGIKRIHFGYNVKTRQLTKIKEIDEGNIEVWLHTNNLVSLPSTPA